MSVLRCGGRGEDTKIFAINDTLKRGIAAAKLAQTARKSYFFFYYVIRMLPVLRVGTTVNRRPNRLPAIGKTARRAIFGR